MAALSAITLQLGVSTRIGDAQVLQVGAGVDTNIAGTLTVGSAVATTVTVGGAATTQVNVGSVAGTNVQIGNTTGTVTFPGVVSFTSTIAAPDVEFQGNVTIGDAAADNLTVTASIVGDLNFKKEAAHTLRVATSTTDGVVGGNLFVRSATGAVGTASSAGSGGDLEQRLHDDLENAGIATGRRGGHAVTQLVRLASS